MRRVQIIFTFILLVSCVPKTELSYPIYIYNETDNQSIGYYFAVGGRYASCYPDTLLPKDNIFVYNKNIKPMEHFHYDSQMRWDKVFQLLPKDTLSIFIFSSDTLNKYDWEEMRKGYKILKRYDLSIQDLDLLGYGVYYPPITIMSEMKMYPKYER